MERSVEIEGMVRDLYAAMAAGDEKYLDRFIAPGDHVLGIGTDPKEWWRGSDTFGPVFKQQIVELSAAGSLQVTPGDLRGYRQGDTGWLADSPTFRLPDGTELPLRITAVFLHTDGADAASAGWRCVQWHASIGIANEEALGQELTV